MEYKDWLESMERLLKQRRPDIRANTLDPNFKFQCYQQGMSPFDFVNQPNLIFSQPATAPFTTLKPAPTPQGQAGTAPTPASPTNKDAAKGCIVIFAILVFLGFIIDKAGCSANREIEAFVMSTEFVNQRLRAPATADFPHYQDSFVRTISENEYEVHAYVDAENGFGAKIRSFYTCRLRYAGNGEWENEGTEIISD